MRRNAQVQTQGMTGEATGGGSHGQIEKMYFSNNCSNKWEFPCDESPTIAMALVFLWIEFSVLCAPPLLKKRVFYSFLPVAELHRPFVA